MLLKAVGIVMLVALVLVGALLPLKYTARTHPPGRRSSIGPPNDPSQPAE